MSMVFGTTFLASAQASSDPQNTPHYLRIIHLNVGQGDGTLIIGPDGTTVLVDAGDRGKGRSVVAPALKVLGVKRLDYVVASHYHADHIRGMAELSAFMADEGTVRFGRSDCIEPSSNDRYCKKKTATLKAFEALPGRFVAVNSEQGDIPLGGGAMLKFLSSDARALPSGDQPTSGSIDENARSVSLLVTYGDFDYFVGGDLTGDGSDHGHNTADMEILIADAVGDIDVLQVNHHGSKSSSGKAFLEAIKPEVAVISVGTGGSNLSRNWHHPTRPVLNRFGALQNSDG